MDRNVCGVERLARAAVALGLLVYGYRNRDSTPGTLAFVAGSDLFATAVIQRCPVSAVLGVDTCSSASPATDRTRQRPVTT